MKIGSFKNIFRDFIRFILPNLWYVKIRFFISHRFFLSLDNPKKFVEKIQYRKMYCDNEYYSNFADKYHVREYIRDCIGEEYLIPLLGVYDNITKNELESLPLPFVIKTTHGGGGKFVKIVKNKSEFDFSKLAKEFNSLLRIKTGSKIDEYFYDIKKPKIIVEKAILENNLPPLDYKFHIFHGRCIFIQIDERCGSSHRMSLFDRDFNEISCRLNAKLDNLDLDNIVKPSNINLLLSLAEKISEPFDYVRVDMYSTNNRIYFGEITFCPSSGWSRIDPPSWDKELGTLWNLDMENP